MAIIGGDIREITYNHPTLGSGSFYVKSGEDSTFNPGGFKTNDDANQVTGNGKMIRQMNNTRWKVECVSSWDEAVFDLERFNNLHKAPQLATWTIEKVDGSIWKGLGCPVGELDASGNESTFPLVISGGGELEKIQNQQ